MIADVRAVAQHYLSSPAGSFWRWADDSQALVWSDGTTIAFREEVEHVLKLLAGGAMPPLGAVALMLAACRDHWPQSAAQRAILWNLVSTADPHRSPAARVADDLLPTIFDGLDTIAALAADERQSLEAKAAIAVALFARGEEPDTTAKCLCEALQHGLGGLHLVVASGDVSPISDLNRALYSLRDAFGSFDPKKLALRSRIGLDNLPQAAPDEVIPQVPASVGARRLLEEFKDDERLAGLARLARQLTAVLEIPRPVSAPDELALGGVSDISNRGSLDRLLVSELAHDNLTLAVRVALGEALYLRREIPPQPPVGERMVLLDAGIRLWGVPRIIAAAVGLTLASLTHRGASFRAFRASGESMDEVDLITRDGFIEHMEAMEASPHPGDALWRFLQEARSAGSAVELFLATHADVLDDPDFQRALAELDREHLYVVTVEAEGQVRVWRVSRAGRVLLRACRVTPEELLPEPSSGALASPIRVRVDPNLPAIFSIHPCPLLIATELRTVHFATHPEHGMVAAQSGRLWHWPSTTKAARCLKSSVSGLQLIAVGLDDTGTAHALGRRHQPSTQEVEVIQEQVRTGSCGVVTLPVTQWPRGAWFADGAVCLVLGRDVSSYSLVTGEKLRTLALPGFPQTISQRYINLTGAGWCAVSCHGGDLTLDKVPVHIALSAMFDRAGMDGPWGLGGGRIWSFAADTPCALAALRSPDDRVTQVYQGTHDGRALAVRTDAKGKETAILDLERGGVHALSLQGLGYTPPRSVHRHVVSAGCSEAGNLFLVTSRGMKLECVFSRTLCEPFLKILAGAQDLPTYRFRPARFNDIDQRTKLSVLESDGRKLFLDSRGMLHLKGRSGEPELSIVLTSNEAILAGWMSDGQTFGDPYYLEGSRSTDGSAAYQMLRRFAEGLR